MKDPVKLQQKLRSILKGRRDIHIRLPILSILPMTDMEFEEAAWIVKAYLQDKDSVLDGDDPLRTWLEEYQFFIADRK
jgi:hypothetical protein